MGVGDTEAAAGGPVQAQWQDASVWGVVAEPPGPAPDRVGAIEVPADDDAQADAGGAAGLLGELQPDAAERHGVVLGDAPFVLLTQDLLELDAKGHEGGDGIGGGRVKVAL
jgi:hypothetical protein